MTENQLPTPPGSAARTLLFGLSGYLNRIASQGSLEEVETAYRALGDEGRAYFITVALDTMAKNKASMEAAMNGRIKEVDAATEELEGLRTDPFGTFKTPLTLVPDEGEGIESPDALTPLE